MGATTIAIAAGAVISAAAAGYQYHQSQNTGINTGKIETENKLALQNAQRQADQQSQYYREWLDMQAMAAEEGRAMMEEQMRLSQEAQAKSDKEKAEFEAKKARRLALGASGRQSTILTGGAGLGSTAPVGRKTLLGS